MQQQDIACHVDPHAFHSNSSNVWDPRIAQRIAALTCQSGAFLTCPFSDQTKWFTLKNGIPAPCVCDIRKLYGPQHHFQEIISYMETLIRLEFPSLNLLLSSESSGIPLLTRLSARIGCRMSYVRSIAKDHGARNLIECAPDPNSTAVIVDDTCASGQTISQIIDTVKSELDINVIGVVTVINWNMSRMRATLANKTPRVLSLASYPELLQAARHADMIDDVFSLQATNYLQSL